MAKPYFEGPIPFVKVPPGSNGPLFSKHNHCPSITFCPNGDLLAVWFTTNTEPGREMAIAASRLRRGDDAWETASLFLKAPDRNMTGSSLFNDGWGTLYHFNGLEAGDGWANLALVLRTSSDNGATWRTRLINPFHQPRNQVIDGTFVTSRGHLIQPCDAVYGTGGTAIHVSRDGGKTWTDPGAGSEKPDFHAHKPGSTIAGIHAGVVELRDGRLLALGRGQNRLGSDENIGQRMPRSISVDMGKSWTYSASPFPPIGGNQRPVLRRLDEGPLLFVSFTHDYFGYRRSGKKPKGLVVHDSEGNPQTVYGMFAALSFDEGKTWPVKKPITPGGPARMMHDVVLSGSFLLDATHAEPRGYLAATETPDGLIHLISSGLHYRFNLQWLRQPMAPPPPEPKPADHPVKGQLGRIFKPTALPSKAADPWRFSGSGMKETEAVSFTKAGMLIDTGNDQRARWANLSPAGFAAADAVNGLTAEIRMQIVKSTTKNRGIDFEFRVPGNRYFLTVTRTAVHWIDGGVQLIAGDLDNHSAMHTYRLAVDLLGRVQIFRDSERIGLCDPAGGADHMLGTNGAYLQWGDGAGASETDAIIEHVAYDLAGPFAPPSK